MGEFISSMCVKAASGTWPPLGKCEVEAICPPPKAVSDAIVEDRPEEEVEFMRLVVAAVRELVGPYNWLEDDPPDTNPADPAALVAALVRMKRSRRSKGFC